MPPSGSWMACDTVIAATLTTRPTLSRGARRRLLGLLEAETQAMALGVERDDLQLRCVWPSWTTSPGWATR